MGKQGRGVHKGIRRNVKHVGSVARRAEQDKVLGPIKVTNDGFPARFYEMSEGERDYRDQVEAAVALSKEVAAVPGTEPIQISISPSTKAVEWQRAKENAQFYIGLEQWIEAEYVNSGDLAKKQFILQQYPEYFSAREKEFEANAEFQVALAKLMLRGAQTKEELQLEYLIKQGIVPIPDKPVWRHDGRMEAEGQKMMRGFLNPNVPLPNVYAQMPAGKYGYWDPATGVSKDTTTSRTDHAGVGRWGALADQRHAWQESARTLGTRGAAGGTGSLFKGVNTGYMRDAI